MQMAQQDFPIHLPDSLMEPLGLTTQDVEQYPPIKAYSDKLLYAITDACRKSLVGTEGTNLQMIDAILNGNEGLVLGQVCLFLVKNQIKPMASDLFLLVDLVKVTATRLGEGDMHAVNRRQQLTAEGVLKPAGDDIVPDAVRAEWVGGVVGQ